LDPEYANSLNGLFTGSTAIDVSSATIGSVVLTGSNNTLSVGSGNSNLESGNFASTGTINATGSISTSGSIFTSSQVVASGNISGANVGCVNLTATGNITATVSTTIGGIGLTGSGNTLSIGDGNSNLQCGAISAGATVTSTAFRGGLGKVVFTVNVPALGPVASYVASATIPNFVGNGTTTAYVVNAYLSTMALFVGASYSSDDGVNTVVDVTFTSGAGGTGALNGYLISVIAMN
jgi:hypothetical protein